MNLIKNITYNFIANKLNLIYCIIKETIFMNNTSNTINMTIRIDKNLKKSVDKLFKNLGISTNSAINMFLKQCDREQRLIFTPSMAPAPSKELLESLQEMEDYKKGKIQLNSFKTTKELFEYLDK